MKKYVFLPLLLLLLSPLAVFAQHSRRDGLVGIKVMRVVIESLDAEAKEGALNDAQLKSDVELRLRKAGITVIDDNDETALAPYLYVNINTIKSDQCNFRASNTVVRFSRLATPFSTVKREPLFASMWHRAYLGVSSNRYYSDSTRDTVGQLVDAFINDYLAANPKP